MPPVDPDAKIPCPTHQHLQAELDDLALILDPPEREDTWEKFERGIIRFAGVTRGGGYKHLDVYIEGVGRKGVGPRLVDCMLSDRGRLSGVSTDLLTTLAPRLGLNFQPLVLLYLPPLVRLLARPNKVYLKRAEKCLSTIITHCPLTSILPHLRLGLDDKAETCRRLSATGLERAVNEWGREIFGDKGAKEFEGCLRKMATDKDAEVRKISKRVWAGYNALWPERVEEFSDPLTPTIRRYLDIPAKGAAPSKTKAPGRPVPANNAKPLPPRVQALGNKPHRPQATIAAAELQSIAGPSNQAVTQATTTLEPQRTGPIPQSTITSNKVEQPENNPLKISSSAPLRAPHPDPPVALRHARSISHNVLPTIDKPLNPLSRPSRPILPTSFSTTSLPLSDSTEVEGPVRRFAPPARIIRPALPEEDDKQPPLLGPVRLGPSSDRWNLAALGKRPNTLGQAQRRVVTAPTGSGSVFDSGPSKSVHQTPGLLSRSVRERVREMEIDNNKEGSPTKLSYNAVHQIGGLPTARKPEEIPLPNSPAAKSALQSQHPENAAMIPLPDSPTSKPRLTPVTERQAEQIASETPTRPLPISTTTTFDSPLLPVMPKMVQNVGYEILDSSMELGPTIGNGDNDDEDLVLPQKEGLVEVKEDTKESEVKRDELDGKVSVVNEVVPTSVLEDSQVPRGPSNLDRQSITREKEGHTDGTLVEEVIEPSIDTVLSPPEPAVVDPTAAEIAITETHAPPPFPHSTQVSKPAAAAPIPMPEPAQPIIPAITAAKPTKKPALPSQWPSAAPAKRVLSDRKPFKPVSRPPAASSSGSAKASGTLSTGAGATARSVSGPSAMGSTRPITSNGTSVSGGKVGVNLSSARVVSASSAASTKAGSAISRTLALDSSTFTSSTKPATSDTTTNSRSEKAEITKRPLPADNKVDTATIGRPPSKSASTTTTGTTSSNLTKPTASTTSRQTANALSASNSARPGPTTSSQRAPPKPLTAISTLPPIRKEKVKLKAPLPSFRPVRKTANSSVGVAQASGLVTASSSASDLAATAGSGTSKAPASSGLRAKVRPENIVVHGGGNVRPAEIALPPSPISASSNRPELMNEVALSIPMPPSPPSLSLPTEPRNSPPKPTPCTAQTTAEMGLSQPNSRPSPRNLHSRAETLQMDTSYEASETSTDHMEGITFNLPHTTATSIPTSASPGKADGATPRKDIRRSTTPLLTPPRKFDGYNANGKVGVGSVERRALGIKDANLVGTPRAERV